MHAPKYIVKTNNYTKKLCTDEHTYKYVKSVDFIQLATTGKLHLVNVWRLNIMLFL